MYMTGFVKIDKYMDIKDATVKEVYWEVTLNEQDATNSRYSYVIELCSIVLTF